MSDLANIYLDSSRQFQVSGTNVALGEHRDVEVFRCG